MNPYFLDSNIFANAKILDKKYGQSCARIITDVSQGSLSGATSSLVVIEVANALRKLGRSREVSNEVDAIYSLGIPVYELLNSDVRLAVELFGISKAGPYDCVHAAIMRRTGVSSIISTDPEFDTIPGIKRLDPLKYR